MSRTLHLIRRLLARARKLHKLGVEQEALLLLGRIASFRDLPPGVAAEVQRRQAELLLKRRKYLQARRHLAALLAHDPDNPHYHHLMGRAVEKDTRGEPGRAVEHYRRALELKPRHPRYLADFGLAALRTGKDSEGLAALRGAAEVGADDPTVFAKVADGLGQRRRYREAEKTLREALFRNSRDPRFRKIWNDFRFAQVRDEQEAARRRRAGDAGDTGPVLLPFVCVADGGVPAEHPGLKLFRHDGSATLPHPHLPRRTRKGKGADQKHAQ